MAGIGNAVDRGSAAGGLLADLQRLGFSEYEARIYLSLLKTSPATAYEVSKAAGLPRSNTYAALESLTKKGAVQPISENPVRFAPVEPKVLLGRLSREITDVCDRLVANIRDFPAESQSDVVWTISGGPNIDAKISEMIRGAKRHVWIKAADEMLQIHRADLKRAAKRGVDILIVLFGSEPERFVFGPTCRIYLHEGNGVRLGGADNLFTVTADFEIALTASISTEVTGAYTRSEPIVRMAETLIRHDYYMAEIFLQFGPQIDMAFGPNVLSLRRNTFSPSQLAYLESNLEASGQKPAAASPAAARRRSDRPSAKAIRS